MLGVEEVFTLQLVIVEAAAGIYAIGLDLNVETSGDLKNKLASQLSKVPSIEIEDSSRNFINGSHRRRLGMNGRKGDRYCEQTQKEKPRQLWELGHHTIFWCDEAIIKARCQPRNCRR
jgi:hypothetical protein